MRKWLLLVSTVTLFGCDGADDSSPLPSAAPVAHPSAPKPGQDEGTDVATKFKPLIMDLGGRLARTAAEGCGLTVHFSSIGTGTDVSTKKRIQQLLEEETAVLDVEPYVVGREGEAVLCIRLRQESETDRVFDELQATASNAYLVGIRSKSGREFNSPGKVRT